jgi:hypothetical protein
VISSLIFEGEIVPADWSQFLPDVLSGFVVSIPVGVLVGVALWRWQKGAEERRAARVANAEWQQARAVIAMSLTRPLVHTANGANLPRFASALDPLLETTKLLRVGEWAEAAPGNKELAAIAALHIDGWTLKRWATALDEDMAIALTRHGNVQAGYTSRFVEWASAAVLEISDPGEYVNDPQDQLREQAEKMLNYPDIAQDVAAFQKKLQDVAANYKYLRGSILNV